MKKAKEAEKRVNQGERWNERFPGAPNPFREFTCLVLLFSCIATFATPATADNDGPATLPQVYMKTSFPDTTNYAVVNVGVGGDLQAAINNASCSPNGTVIRLAAGATFTGNYVLPLKVTAPGKWIIIRTDRPDSDLPAPGTRINPSYSPLLARIITSNSMAAIRTASGANHYWFMGVEIGLAAGVNLNYGLFVVGNGETVLSNVPSFIVLDRVYLHGNGTGEISRGLAPNGASIAAVNCYFEKFQSCTGKAGCSSFDTQAIGCWSSPGPIKIVNNYLEGGAENVIFGGAKVSITNLVNSDIEIRQNHFFKPLFWRQGDPSFAGTIVVVKNLLEFKNAQRVLVEGNIFEHNWAQAQSGFGILFTPRGPQDGGPWATVADITFRYNLYRESACGFNISGEDNTGPSQPSQRISIHDNLMIDINGPAWSSSYGRLYQILTAPDTAASPHDITISHNTAFIDGAVILSGDAQTNPIQNFTFVNNIQPHGTRGVIGSGTADGIGTLNVYYSNAVLSDNIFESPPQGFNPARYPSGNYFPPDWSTVFVDSSGGDFHVLRTSPYHNSGTDGKDLGADIDRISVLTAGVIEGNPAPDTTSTSVNDGVPMPQLFKLHQNYPNPFNPRTTIRYELPKSSMVTLSVYDILGREVKTLVNEAKQPGTYTVEFDGSGLASGVYFYRLQAGGFVEAKKLLLLR